MVVPGTGAWLFSSWEPIVLCRLDRDVCGKNSSTGCVPWMLMELGPTCIGCCSWNRLCCWLSVDVELLPEELWSWKDMGSAGSGCWIPTRMLPIGDGPWVWVLKRIVGGIAWGLRSVVQRRRPVQGRPGRLLLRVEAAARQNRQRVLEQSGLDLLLGALGLSQGPGRMKELFRLQHLLEGGAASSLQLPHRPLQLGHLFLGEQGDLGLLGLGLRGTWYLGHGHNDHPSTAIGTLGRQAVLRISQELLGDFGCHRGDCSIARHWKGGGGGNVLFLYGAERL
ncbi:hypothetical protein EYF80_018894 [Liparis tanakae]|uniref:Uncharacterized protein n=1 Tax=Liparis tanakae TaxID=230148 RepID=A0A4Z2HYH8_9TELE|nr:hypothetical protein EYF80_018894 [Liparis tanakae]